MAEECRPACREEEDKAEAARKEAEKEAAERAATQAAAERLRGSAARRAPSTPADSGSDAAQLYMPSRPAAVNHGGVPPVRPSLSHSAQSIPVSPHYPPLGYSRSRECI